MNWIKVLQPTKGKIIFTVFYFSLGLFWSWLGTNITDIPHHFGFPFTFIISGCYMRGGCVNEFYPLALLVDISIPIGIYIGVSIIASRKSG